MTNRQTKKLIEWGIQVIDGDRGKNYPNQSELKTSGDCLFLSAANVTKTGFKFNDNAFIDNKKDDMLGKGKLVRGDIVLTTRGTVGNIAHYSSEVVFSKIRINSGMAIIRNNEQSGLTTLYLLHYLMSPIHAKEIDRVVFGSAQPQLTIATINKFPVLAPEKPEQERIVSVLEVWDEYIEKLEQKIALKEQLKKGLMQQLLTGNRRLPGFAEEWKAYQIGKLGDTYTGLSGKSKEDFGYGEPFITYMNIYASSVIKMENMQLVRVERSERQSTVQRGDIFFTTSSETPNEVGISSVFLEDVKMNIYLNSFCFGFRMHNMTTLTPEYAAYYFRGNDFRQKMTRLAQGASRYNLSKKYFMDTEIYIPAMDEQLAIVDILNSIDTQIDNHALGLENLKLQKKYLLKNLITGTIRTPEDLKPLMQTEVQS